MINSVAATDGVMRAAEANAGAAYVNGSISTAYLKNPTNPKYRTDAAVRQYNQLMTKYGPSGANRADTFYYYGFAKAYDVVKLLYAAGKNPTRESLRRATQRMNWVNPYMIKGVRHQDLEDRQLPARPDQDRSLQRPLLERGQQPVQGSLGLEPGIRRRGRHCRPRLVSSRNAQWTSR